MKIPNVAFDKWEYDPEKLSALLWLARSRDYSTGEFTQGVRALALRYDWSIGKSHRFWHSAVEHFRNSSGTVVEQQRNTKSAPMANLSGSTRTEPEQERNSSGTVVEHIQEEEEDKDKVTTPPIVPQEGHRVKKNGVEYKPDFLAFWNAYPSKVGKGTALKAWEKADVSIAVVLESLEWQRNLPGWTKDGGQFIPHPATYLNQRRWEDEKPEPKRGVFAFLGDDDGEQEEDERHL